MYATIFYSKNTGKIKTYCITEIPQDMNYFGEDKTDYEQIYDFIVLEYTNQVELIIKNRELFIVDTESKQITQKNINLNL